MRPVNRITPQLAAHEVKTYQVSSPLATHYRPASCAEVDCAAMAGGWQSVIDETTPLGQRQAHYIRNEAGRKFTSTWDGGLTTFVFEAGQKCFEQHHVPLDRPEIYLVRDGDWRGNPRNTEARRHSGPDAWLDDFATHQQTLADLLDKG